MYVFFSIYFLRKLRIKYLICRSVFFFITSEEQVWAYPYQMSGNIVCKNYLKDFEMDVHGAQCTWLCQRPPGYEHQVFGYQNSWAKTIIYNLSSMFLLWSKIKIGMTQIFYRSAPPVVNWVVLAISGYFKLAFMGSNNVKTYAVLQPAVCPWTVFKVVKKIQSCI